ncbi:MAG: flagellar basal body protein [Novosphingobium sp.]|nr:flagellar basal body protein [Novosphingobium sp.]
MIIGAERRIEVTAANVSNMNTPGYKARRIFSETVYLRSGLPNLREVQVNPAAGLAMTNTGAPFDLSTDAGAALALRSSKGLEFVRTAQLHRDADGRLVDMRGRALQGSDLADLVVSDGAAQIMPDGTVLVAGQPEARVGLFDEAASNLAGSPEPLAANRGVVRQGMVLGSGVELGDEMLELNKASRMAETGAKLFQLGDDLLARAASQLGSIGK